MDSEYQQYTNISEKTYKSLCSEDKACIDDYVAYMKEKEEELLKRFEEINGDEKDKPKSIHEHIKEEKELFESLDNLDKLVAESVKKLPSYSFSSWKLKWWRKKYLIKTKLLSHIQKYFSRKLRKEMDKRHKDCLNGLDEVFHVCSMPIADLPKEEKYTRLTNTRVEI